MTIEKRYDSTLEEMWQIKREIAAEYPSLEVYFKGFLAEQAERERGTTVVMPRIWEYP